MYKQKLIELLKKVPEIKEDLEKDKFLNTEYKVIQRFESWEFWTYEIWEELYYWTLQFENVKYNHENCLLKIWNELEERHLRIYCNSYKPKLNMLIDNLWKLWFWACVICILDNSKSFDNQSEDFYEKLYNYLIKI